MPPPEELLIRIINHLAERIKNRLVLKGGMLLRLYRSPRSTQDVDFVLLSEESKKKLQAMLVKSLETLEGVRIEAINLNSRGIFIDVTDRKQKALIEVTVLPSMRLPSEPLSTAALSEKYSLGGRIVSTMAIPEAFAHKIAAALERDAVRDLFDLSQLEAMGPLFDAGTLSQRLAQFSINRSKPKSINTIEAANLLKKRLGKLDQKRIATELHPLLPPEYHTGILGIIRASVGRIIQRLENL